MCFLYLKKGPCARGLHVGGNWNNTASNPGLFNWNVNNTPDNANVNIVARLLLLWIFEPQRTVPHRLVKIMALRMA